MKHYDLIVIGGGCAGLATAISAAENGVKDILVLERERQLGGMLNLCIHVGYGETVFKDSLTGPEFSQRLIDMAESKSIAYKTNTTVLKVSKDKVVTTVSGDEGLVKFSAAAVLFATGCREKPRGFISMSNFRFAGVYTIGTAQKLISQEGYMPGKAAIIIGSDDRALHLARRMTLEGAEIKAVIEKASKLKGSKTLIEDCQRCFNIPILNPYRVVNVQGKDRIEGVIIKSMRDDLVEKELFIPCDTLLLSVRLCPDDSLFKALGFTIDSKKGITNAAGFFVCGNVVYFHNSADTIVQEAYKIGENIASYVKEH